MNLADGISLLIAIKFCMKYGVVLRAAAAAAAVIERFDSGWSMLDGWGDDSMKHMAFNCECRWQLLEMRLHFYWKYLLYHCHLFPSLK